MLASTFACLLKPLEICQWKWEDVTMNSMVGLPKAKLGNGILWVIVDRLTKSIHPLPIKNPSTTEKLIQMYMENVACLLGVPISIVSDHDLRFTSKFCEDVTMNSVVGLPKTKLGNSIIWVTVDRLTKFVYLLPMKNPATTVKFIEMYMENVPCLHGVPNSIVLDHELIFTSKFWTTYH